MSVHRLASQIKSSNGVLVVTGAGISVASGISPFRGSDPGAVWNRDVLEKGTFSYFREDVLGSWTWYLERFSSIFGKHPNAGHTALVKLESWCRNHGRDFTLVTQNIDGLHKSAGSKDVFEVHGTARRLRCATRGCRYGEPHGSVPFPLDLLDLFKSKPVLESIPKCLECKDFLRPHVLWFDEYYTAHTDYRYRELAERLSTVELIIFVGTSFSVGITASVIELAMENNISMWTIDPCDPQIHEMQWLEASAETLLPDLVKELDSGTRDNLK